MENLINKPGICRRKFINSGIRIAFVCGLTGFAAFAGCANEEEEKDVSPPEDLMQEHGVLNRILLIYDHCKVQLVNKQSIPNEALLRSAGIIRKFVEDYHEKQEENYLFTRFEKANQLTDLIHILRQQHKTGRAVTDKIIGLSKMKTMGDLDNQKLIQSLTDFNNMYRPHEAREDTVLFPAFRKLVTRHEYDSLAEEFEKNEQRLFGKNGFESIVENVASIEKQLGIYEL